MSSAPYAPDDPAHSIRREVAWLQGAFISSHLCGVQITLSAMSFLAVLKQRMRNRLRIALLVYIFLLCAIMTAGQQGSLLFVQTGFVESRNYPGGPSAFLRSQYRTPVSVASVCLFVFGNWMMEGLLVWRCYVVCCVGDRPMWFGVIIPSMLLVSEYVSGALFLHEMLQGQFPITYALVYTSLSLLLNISVTAIIAGRLLLHRRRMVRLFGPGHGSLYASAAAILIESASLYTGFLILVIIFFSIGTPVSNILQHTIAQVQAISSLLIIYRVAQGKGWKSDAGVSSGDWRGDTEAQVEQVAQAAVRQPEPTPDPPHVSTTANDVHTSLSALGKHDEAQTPTSTSCVAANVSRDESG